MGLAAVRCRPAAGAPAARVCTTLHASVNLLTVTVPVRSVILTPTLVECDQDAYKPHTNSLSTAGAAAAAAVDAVLAKQLDASYPATFSPTSCANVAPPPSQKRAELCALGFIMSQEMNSQFSSDASSLHVGEGLADAANQGPCKGVLLFWRHVHQGFACKKLVGCASPLLKAAVAGQQQPKQYSDASSCAAWWLPSIAEMGPHAWPPHV